MNQLLKKNYSLTIAFLAIFSIASSSQKVMKMDLHTLVNEKGIAVVNRVLGLVNEEHYKGISLSKDEGEGIAWIKDIEFSNGIIEFDVRGENIKQHSFVGIAFHGVNDDTYDAIYLRPFQFQEQDQVLRDRSIQYISLPDFTWRKLREQSPGKYENSIEPSPNPDSWIRIRIVIKDAVISTYINGNKEPSLVVNKVTSVKTGSIGFYVADTSGGDFANLSITKTD